MLELQQTSQEIWQKKYCLTDKDGNAIDKSVDDSYLRVATKLASVESEEKREEYLTQFIWAMQNGATPAGRIMSNAGAEKHKPETSTINCTVSDTVQDSMKDILMSVYEAGLTLKAGCGIGYEFSTLRPKEAYVAGAGAYTSGPLSFMDIFDKMCFTVSSAGGRRGAQMATFDISHPDVVDYIKAKREDGRLRQFNLSLLITKEFVEAVKANVDWKLAFPIKQRDFDTLNVSLKQLEDEGKIVWREFPGSDGYIYDDTGKVAQLVYNVIPAKRLWDVVMTSTYDFAEPGFILIDKVNEMNNLWFCENIRSTNPSMPAGTLVHTRNGIFPIQKLEGKNFLVRSLDGKWAPATCKLSGKNQQLLEIEFEGNRTIKATREHRWPVLNKSNGLLEKKYTKDLMEGDFIPLNLPMTLNIQGDLTLTNDEGFLLGVFIGDGWLTKRTNGKGHTMGFSINNKDLDVGERILSIVNSQKSNPSSMTNESNGSKTIQISDSSFIEWFMDRFNIKPKDKKFPKIVWTSNDNFIKGFIDGLVSSDGYARKGQFVYTTKSKKFAYNFAKLLGFLGIKPSVSKNISDVTVNGHIYKDYCVYRVKIQGNLNLTRLLNFVDVTCNRRKYDLELKFYDEVKKGRITDYYNVVQSVNTVEHREDVWDISVFHNEHVFPTEWGYTGNCGEQPLPSYGACLLGSINLTKFVNNPFTDQASFDYDKFAKVVGIFTRMLDNVVEFNGLPLEKQREEITLKRRHGMGYYGLGSALTMMGIVYGSDESVKFTDTVTKQMAIIGWETGIELAKEKGTAPIFEQEYVVTKEMLAKRPEMKKDKFKVGDSVTGLVLFAKYSRYMQQFKDEYPELIDRILKHGCRFSHHTSIAPTGTIALSYGNNASNGIEPSFSHHYMRNVIIEGKKTKQQMDVYSFELMLYRHLINKDAMPFGDEENKLPSYFISADTIDPRSHVDVQAAAQKWIDSSISKTINVPTDFPYEQFKDIYMYAYDKGLKGCTTFRFNPEAFSGVLVKQTDLENTVYQFTLDDGTIVELKGDETVEYDGDTHIVANLFDSLKEGYYGKF